MLGLFPMYFRLPTHTLGHPAGDMGEEGFKKPQNPPLLGGSKIHFYLLWGSRGSSKIEIYTSTICRPNIGRCFCFFGFVFDFLGLNFGTWARLLADFDVEIEFYVTKKN